MTSPGLLAIAPHSPPSPSRGEETNARARLKVPPLLHQRHDIARAGDAWKGAVEIGHHVLEFVRAERGVASRALSAKR